ncbi:MAG: PAM68 family protein [Microcystaceae cyanobacterium]
MPASPSNRLPFDGKPKKKKPEKKPPIAPSVKGDRGSTARVKRGKPSGVIPEAVSQRMIKRMALFSGIPTAMGMFSFIAFYWIVSHDWLEIPNYAVFAVSLLFLGIGVVGLSYGIFSTSWEEDLAGSWWGWQEFKLNFGRTVTGWKTAKAEAQQDREK